MTKVLIVEDETLIRVGLRSIIDNKDSGFEVCAEANNGFEALELLLEKHPEIILLDIKMPIMDGIEFLKEKKRLGDTTPVIVLSCHGEYEYVREAMKLGARDYIMKLSTKPQDILVMLEQISIEINHNTINDQNEERVSQIDNLLRSVCTKGEAWEQLMGIAGKGNTVISADKNYVICMLLDKKEEDVLNLFSENKNLLPDNTVLKLLGSVLKGKGEFFCMESNEFTIVLPMNSNSNILIREVCKEIRNQLLSYFKITATFGISEANSIKDLQNGVMEARLHAGMRFYMGPDTVISKSDMTDFIHGILPNDIISESHIMEAIISKSKEKMLRLVDEMLVVIRKVHPEPTVAVNYLIEINALIISCARKVIEPGTAISLDLIIKFFRVCQTLGEMAEGMKQFIKILYDNLDDHWKLNLRDEITDAMIYISEHYHENISLDDIAMRFHMSTSRFCVVFKEGTGKTFLDYLNMVRIKEAEKLLLSSNLAIYKIAFQVGFKSNNYFSKIFRRFTGKHPSEYRISWTK